jgi:hypothetical protein
MKVTQFKGRGDILKFARIMKKKTLLIRLLEYLFCERYSDKILTKCDLKLS